MTADPWPGEWLRGVLDVCVLAVLAEGTTYGYAISRRGAERLLELLPVVGPLDVFLSSKFPELRVRCAVPPLVHCQPRSLDSSDIVRSAHQLAAAVRGPT